MKKFGLVLLVGFVIIVVGWLLIRVEFFDKPQSAQQTRKEDFPSKTTLFKLKISMNGQSFAATLEDNETTQEFRSRLPMELDMSELNGNEKYNDLEDKLSVDARKPEQIVAGDIMLYGDNCLVLFYESHSTDYAYTKIAKIDDPVGLAEAVGDGNVTVKFELVPSADPE